MSTIRLLQKEGVNKLHSLVVSGARADADAVRRLQEMFHPQQTEVNRGKEKSGWAAGSGGVCISPAR
jgi:hypothetical protein